MMDAATPGLALTIAGGAGAGFAVGLIYFAMLRRAVAGFVGAQPVWSPILWTALRIALAIGAFWLLVQWSAAAAIAGLVGFTLANVTLRLSPGAR